MNLSHLDSQNNPLMVDVSSKNQSSRVALACGKICMSKQAYQAVLDNQIKKGPVLQTAIIAAIMGAKQTSTLIPMCHPLPLAGVHVEVLEKEEECAFVLKVSVRCQAQTGVEMEALTGVSIGLLTIYDMVKGLDKSMVIGEIYLEHKSGGKSGEYFRNKE
ncbi:cyclic pyranopterin monophosphate synthase MoaC [Helicobacter cynogastricus]|uniref:cyclic pyranopterin monophosphate synthase MoaC n=1 Tax=Helicobacter cynogastricus TaxID=329937 RepID=UPI000CF19ACB|nr:cyclic pyranopterin monophosphate synthase MoaC [Helicobacter cynogastricus]